MPIRDNGFGRRARRHVDDTADRLTDAVVYRLSVIGEQVVNHAKSLPSPPEDMRGEPHQPNYIDDTSNLRKSIGYVIAVDGNVTGLKGFDGQAGQAGMAYARRLAKEQPRGTIALIAVAGMKYASCVTNRGYDVLDSAELKAESLVPQMLRKLGLIN